MRRLRGNSRGLSEIVGTLMLVLIVVGAAVAFAAFVAGYEKQLLAQESVTHERNLEALRILSVSPVSEVTGDGQVVLLTASFVVSSETVNQANVTNITIDGIPTIRFGFSTGNSPCSPLATPTPGVVIPPFGQETFCIDANSSSDAFSFASPASVISLETDLQISLYTLLGNDFTTIFLPPGAIATVSLVAVDNGSGISYIPALDGSQSFQPGTNATIVSWAWAVTPNSTSTWDGSCASPAEFSGEIYELGYGGCRFVATDSYTIVLTVTNDVGLVGSQTIQYTYE